MLSVPILVNLVPEQLRVMLILSVPIRVNLVPEQLRVTLILSVPIRVNFLIEKSNNSMLLNCICVNHSQSWPQAKDFLMKLTPSPQKTATFCSSTASHMAATTKTS